MQGVGEVMAIAGTFNESLATAVRALDTGKRGIRDFSVYLINMNQKELENEITNPRPRRLFAIFEALRRGWKGSTISKLTNIDEWFISELEKSFSASPSSTPVEILKKLGWTFDDVNNQQDFNESNVYKLVDTCSAEFNSSTPYLYSTTGKSDDDIYLVEKVVVIGSGPNRIVKVLNLIIVVFMEWCFKRK